MLDKKDGKEYRVTIIFREYKDSQSLYCDYSALPDKGWRMILEDLFRRFVREA